MNIFSSKSEKIYNKIIQKLHKHLELNPNVKKQRLDNVELILDKYKLKLGIPDKYLGLIITGIHIISILSVLYIVFTKITIVKLIILFLLLALQFKLNNYSGRLGCLLTRLERHYYKDKKWFGPATILFRLFNIKVSKFRVDMLILLVTIFLNLFYFIKILIIL